MAKIPPRPTRDDILNFMRENPGVATKREIARAFNIKGEGRIWLKNMLRQMADDGQIEKKGKRHQRSDILPPVALLDIFGRDGDGDLLARPHKAKVQNSSHTPIVTVRPSRHKGGSAVGINVGVGDRILAKIFASKDKNGVHYHARIIRKIDKQPHSALGILRRSERGEWRLQPVIRKQQELIVAADSLVQAGMVVAAKEGDLVEVDFASDRHHGLKIGRLRQIIGHVASEKSLSMIALYAHSIPHIFPEQVLDEAENVRPIKAKREDWRHIDFVTIDPVDAKDHDDAVFARSDDNPLNQGGYEVMVAIADVSAYVVSGSEIDREAEKRGNSVYFPDRVVAMLPERISNHLCSLREGEDRSAIAVRMVFDKEGEKQHHSFHRIIMRSRAKLDYVQVQKAFEGVGDDKTAPILETIIKPLFSAYHLLLAARNKRGPLELDLSERKILLDEAGQIRDVVVPPRLASHRLIEEMMIGANVSAAETLLGMGQELIYRIHDAPPLSRQEVLREFLRSIGYPLARSGDLTSLRLNRLLAQVAGTDEQELVSQMVLRSQAQAEYHPKNIGHFGLALKNYTHFTSPIRRYADLIIHRALIKVLKLGDDGLKATQEARLAEIARAISIAERRAQMAERETVDRLVAHYLAEKTGTQFSARISGVTKAGLFVTLDQLGADGLVPISTLGPEYYHFDEAGHALVGEKTKRGYQLADRVEVRLVEAMPLVGSLRFEMLSAPHPLPVSNVSYHKSSRATPYRRKKR